MCSPSHPISVFICAICGRFPLLLEIYSPTDSTDIHRFYIFQYPCSSVLSVGDSLCCLRFDSPTDSTDIHRFYIFQYPCSSVLSVGDSLCCLRFDSPTDSTDIHRFYIFQYPCSSVLSVEHTFVPNIRVHLCYLWEIPSAA